MACGALAGIVALGVVAWVLAPLPADLLARGDSSSLRIEDRHGIVLRTTRAGDGTRATWTPLAELDPDLLAAFLAVEDRRFHEHGGVDWRAAARAARDNLLAGRTVSGASTITMQLARLLRPIDRSVSGKVGQALWALRLERRLAKQEILEQYLNRVHLGQGTTGVGAAAALYFGASASDVSLAQAALLAGIAQAPARDNPLASPRRARARREMVLDRLARAGYAGADDRRRAAAEPLVTRPRGTPFLAPHFTSWLVAREGQMVRGTVRTSIDVELQRAVEEEVRQTVFRMRDRNVRHAAAVVLDNATGEVLAWVGSPDFWSDTAGQTDMVVSPRQPGSALKPFLYALAFDRGWTPASVLADVPTTYETTAGAYRPRNYDRRFRGPVRAREALASSYNVPAVELADRLGAASLLETLRLAGFASLDRDAEHYGLGLSLGNGDVTLLELANGYRALVNGGVWRPVRWRMVERGAPQADSSRRVASPIAAALVLDILDDEEARIPGFGLETPFEFPFPAAVKTGTSRHYTDNWAIAATGGFTVAVWAGNFSGRPMQGVSGVTGAGPLLQRVVAHAASRRSPGTLASPASLGARSVEICRLSGMRATSGCPSRLEWFAPGVADPAPDDWHREGSVVLPPAFAEWEGRRAARADLGPRPSALGDTVAAARADTSCDGASPPPPPVPSAECRAPASLRIVSPVDGDVYRVPPGVDASYATVALRAAGARGVTRWTVDDRPVRGARLALTRGEHVIRAQAATSIDEVRIVVE
jgi:penicillin-binding protein 1C